ncbi:MAG: spore coat associated protein CotJA [Clostridiales bacterium]|nr:spore coat associated protein CotJA [Clostridiales bacterium]
MIDGYSYNQSGISRGTSYSTSSFISPYPANSRLARAYFIFQRYTKSFPPAEALDKGTMFPDLYSPWPTENREGI